jgi:hypothetical protein
VQLDAVCIAAAHLGDLLALAHRLVFLDQQRLVVGVPSIFSWGSFRKGWRKNMAKTELSSPRSYQIRKLKDGFRKGVTWLSAGCALALLAAIFVNIAQGGASLISWDLLTSDYASSTYTYESTATSASYADPELANASYSPSWGVAFEDTTSFTGESVVSLVYLAPSSPIGKLDGEVKVGAYFTKAFLKDETGATVIALARSGASGVKDAFESGKALTSFSITTKGGGIRGSLLSTLLVIAISLLLSLPLGIGAAVYFAYFARKKAASSAFGEDDRGYFWHSLHCIRPDRSRGIHPPFERFHRGQHREFALGLLHLGDHPLAHHRQNGGRGAR